MTDTAAPLPVDAVPVDALEAVARAMNPGDWDYMNDATRQVEMQTASRLLSAALPHIREQIARDLEADLHALPPTERNAYRIAARIARGGAA